MAFMVIPSIGFKRCRMFQNRNTGKQSIPATPRKRMPLPACATSASAIRSSIAKSGKMRAMIVPGSGDSGTRVRRVMHARMMPGKSPRKCGRRVNNADTPTIVLIPIS